MYLQRITDKTPKTEKDGGRDLRGVAIDPARAVVRNGRESEEEAAALVDT